jgi:multiple sugar transport system ATP-binding protein
MKDGVVQQLDTPQTLYRQPANLFVAAFIGSPSMNLIEATVQGGRLTFAEHRLPVPDGVDLRAYENRSLVLGLRPADFEDAALHRDEGSPTLHVRADVVEELGSEINVIFRIDVAPVATEAVRAAAEPDAADSTVVPLVADANETICTARVNARCPARAGDDVELAIATDRFHFFDLESGEVIINRAQPAATG